MKKNLNFDKSKLKLVVEARPDKNIFYYFTDNQYDILERVMNTWDRSFLGKFSISKCIDYLTDLQQYCDGEDDDFIASDCDFENIIKEEKPLDLNNKIKGMTMDYVFIDYDEK